jgi:TolA-binding protein
MLQEMKWLKISILKNLGLTGPGLLAMVIYLMISPLAIAGSANKKNLSDNEKGLLPEIRVDSKNENENQKKSLQSEILITKAENKAIHSLIQIIEKKKGSTQEPDLWYRLAELYMRRAQSGRFFDLNRSEDTTTPARWEMSELTDETAKNSLRRALQVYTKIEKEFKAFRQMDSVYFNGAFASQQLKMIKNAEALYNKVITQFPKSDLVPDAYLALGEIAFDAQRFSEALDNFQAIERYPQAQVYSYGIYKAAWALYNLHRSDEATKKLVQVVKFHDPKNKRKGGYHNLRNEALRDLTLFFEETQPADKAYEFFAKIANDDEVGFCINLLAKLYNSHSRLKEMALFLENFAKQQSKSVYLVKNEILMIEAYDLNKQRAESLTHLKKAAELCQTTSTWRKQNINTANEECDNKLAHTNMEIAKKWWDLWNKNKTATEAKTLADYTRQVFELHLANENMAQSDFKSRYAYAELLFQLEKYSEAYAQYTLVYNETKVVEPMKHDALYASLVSFEKSKNNKDELLKLCHTYLKNYNKGEFNNQIKFKVGYIAFQNKNFSESKKWLLPLTIKFDAEFTAKSEDILLDIFDAEKDYVAIKKLTVLILSRANIKENIERKKQIEKILVATEYNQIQLQVHELEEKQNDQNMPSRELSKLNSIVSSSDQFFKNYQNSELGKELAQKALWQSVSLLYANKEWIRGADMAQVYAKNYPQDPQGLAALQEATKIYMQEGLLTDAAQVLETIQQINSPKISKNQMAEALFDIYALLGPQKIKEKQKLEAFLLQNKVEPFSSRLQVEKIEKTYQAGKTTEAFNQAKKIINENDLDGDIRARARFIQAAVLETEFTASHMKTSIDKLSLIIGIKTEKMDKAQTAYLSAGKLATDPELKTKALVSLQRIYAHYLDSMQNITLKDQDSLKAEDKQALAEQLSKISEPIAQKKNEIDIQLAKQVQKINPLQVITDNKDIPWNAKDFNLTALSMDQIDLTINSGAKGKCLNLILDKVTQQKITTQDLKINSENCLREKKPSLANNSANSLIRQINVSTENKSMALYYLSLSSQQESMTEASLWYNDLAIKADNTNALFYWQQAAVNKNKQTQLDSITPSLAKAYELGLKRKETALSFGLVQYNNKKYELAANAWQSALDGLNKQKNKSKSELEQIKWLQSKIKEIRNPNHLTNKTNTTNIAAENTK